MTDMLRALGSAFVRYHRGLGKMPARWKPWLTALLVTNMIAPWFFITELEAWVVFAVALLNGATFVVLTAISGFSRLLGLGHIWWIPLVCFLATRAGLHPVDTAFGVWIRATCLLNSLSLVLDVYNVYMYARGDRAEFVEGLLPNIAERKSSS